MTNFIDKTMDTIIFAEKELHAYVSKITGETDIQSTLEVSASVYKKTDYDSFFDDAYMIDAQGHDIHIIGGNPRSVLLGVYDFLATLGVDFSFPGKSRETMPSLSIHDILVKKHINPDRRHRVICLEGSVKYENVSDMIDWAAKNGFNGYFIQFTSGHEFFERWYEHQRNPFIKGDKFTYEEAESYKSSLLKEIKKRDFVYHEMGHGWTNKVLGLPISGWQTMDESSIDDDKQKWLAKVDRERDFYKNTPLSTQLCYSNQEVREAMSDAVLAYAKENQHVDVLHFWLADDFNNFCECDQCRDHQPVDDYITILNLIDKKLSKANIDVKIAFLVYFELRWPSRKEKILNEDRFIMMFAPITRTYTRSYADIDLDQLPDIPKYERNKNHFGDSLEENLAFLMAWKDVFKGDSFLFDYHLMWDGLKDIPQWRLSEIIHKDIRSLDSLGLNGLISCQLQRNFFPTPLAMKTMAKSLINPDTDLGVLKEETCRLIDPDHAGLIQKSMNRMSDMAFFRLMRGDSPLNQNMFKKVDQLRQQVLIFKTFMENNQTISDIYRKSLSFMCLSFIEIFDILKKAYANKMDKKEIKELHRTALRPLIFKHESEIQRIFDGFYADLIWEETFDKIGGRYDDEK